MTTDYTDWTWQELIEQKRVLLDARRREIARLPGLPDQQAQVRQRFAAENEPVDAAIARHRERAEVERYWRQKATDNPIASDLMTVLLDSKSDADVWAVVSDIAGRFEAVGKPEPVIEPEPESMVPYVDSTNPARPFEPPPDMDAMRRNAERRRIGPSTHDDPLAMRAEAEYRRRKYGTPNRLSGAEAVNAAHRAESRNLVTTQPVQADEIWARLLARKEGEK